MGLPIVCAMFLNLPIICEALEDFVYINSNDLI